MDNLRNLLPPASRLIIFEVAGRHRNFSQAAKELGISQAAVSLAVRTLEDDLGVLLFHRAHRAVELTDTGERFHVDVSAGLRRIQESVEGIRAKGGDVSVTLAASTAFASMWMLPRLQRFRNELPDIDLRIQTSVRDLNLMEESIPLSIRGGRVNDWPEYHAALLAPEVITAVATPSFLERHHVSRSLEQLIHHRLIWLEEPVREACDWPEWFASAGVAFPKQARKLVINDYVLVIQAVLAGEGISLGWQHLIAPQLRSGALVPVTSHILRTDLAFYVVWPR
ncbi:MAG TPA: LysR substrate-binding domain-containing protein, partial [Rhizobium sp.]